MASAAAAKKWPRSSKCWSPTSRRYASWTRAVAFEGVPGVLRGHPRGREFSQLVVDQRQQLIGRLAVALLDGREDAGDVAHHRPLMGTIHSWIAPWGHAASLT